MRVGCIWTKMNQQWADKKDFSLLLLLRSLSLCSDRFARSARPSLIIMVRNISVVEAEIKIETEYGDRFKSM